jgi:hypothetical protein
VADLLFLSWVGNDAHRYEDERSVATVPPWNTTDDKKEKFAFFKLIETYIKTAPDCAGAVAFYGDSQKAL